jgi:hypothetical protein
LSAVVWRTNSSTSPGSKVTKVVGQRGAEGVDLLERVGQVHHVAHGERRVDLLLVLLEHQPVDRRRRRDVAPAADHEEVAVTLDDVGEDLGGEDLLLAPDHDVLERVVDVMVAVETLVDRLGIVEQRQVQIGIELLDLVVVERGEQPVPPAERRVRVDDDVLVLVRGAEDLLEHRAAERVEAGDREVQNSPGWDVGRFLVHHLADVTHFEVVAALMRGLLDRFEVGALINADLSGDDGSHEGDCNLWKRSVPTRGEHAGNVRLMGADYSGLFGLSLDLVANTSGFS